MRKAQFLELDLLFAIALLIGGVLLLKGLYIHTYDTSQLQDTAQDAISILQARTVGSLPAEELETLRTALAGSPAAIDEDRSVARQLAMIIVAAEEGGLSTTRQAQLQDAAQTLARLGMEGVTKPQEQYNITLLSGQQRHSIISASGPATMATQARTMLSGLEVNKSITGYTASARLSHAQARQASTYRLGGFVGQGNITLILDVPEQPLGLYLEGDFHDGFALSLNDEHCADIEVSAETDLSTITRADLEECVEHLQVGENEVRINFTGDDINEHYVGGGYLQATYLGDETYEAPAQVTAKHPLPGITGIFNLYDAIHIPGRLQELEVRLHYLSDHTYDDNIVFFSLGDQVLYLDNESTEEQRVTITTKDLQDAGIELAQYENSTVPFRFGYDNGSLEVLASSVIDAVLVTDVSGSMGREFDTEDDGNNIEECDDKAALQDPRTSRISVARCASKNFTAMILGEEQPLEPNRIGLVSYGTRTHSEVPFSEEEESINETIEGYQPLDSPNQFTCICCGILNATRQFEEDQQHSQEQAVTRAMLIMTDGEANRKDDCIAEIGANIGDLDGDGGANNPDDYAVAAACRAKERTGMSIYVVGFGEENVIDEQALQAMANCDNSSHYYPVTQPGALVEIYNSIARDIIRVADYNAQVISFGIEVNDSTVYPDSYIRYTYEPYPLPDHYGRLLIDGERAPFSGDQPCEQTSLNFPTAIYPLDGSILSYSGNRWTDRLQVNEEVLFDLTDYGHDYRFLGDPFSIGIPPGKMNQGPNILSLRTATSPEQPAECSEANKLLYTATLQNTVSLGQVLPIAEGCEWTINVLGEERVIRIPADYQGSTTCTYNEQQITYEGDDAWQALGQALFASFDIDDDGSVDVDFEEQSLDLNLQRQQDIPYLWGPAMLEVTVWR